MTYSFVWSTPSSRAPIVSVASYGITFNSSVIELMKRPEGVMIGFDENNKVVGIKPLCDNEEAISKGFLFASKERKGYVRIGNKDFIKYVSKKTGKDFSTAVRYIGDWDENEQILIVDLNKPLDSTDEEEEE